MKMRKTARVVKSPELAVAVIQGNLQRFLANLLQVKLAGRLFLRASLSLARKLIQRADQSPMRQSGKRRNASLLFDKRPLEDWMAKSLRALNCF